MTLRLTVLILVLHSVRTNYGKEFEPMRIRAFFYELDAVLDETGQQRLKDVTNEAVGEIQKILSVIPVEGSLVLERTLDEACSTVIAEGPNKHKCSHVKGVYIRDGEKCNNEFKIPDDHLSSLAVWNATSAEPVSTVFPRGAGVQGADFLLYVTAQPASNCVQANALAYTKSCSRAESGRPLAAFINVCPKLVMDGYNPHRARLIMLHELFHALAMSRDLFHSFTECQPSGCVVRNVVVEDLGGLPSIVTPRVVDRARRHFGCSEDQKRYFGVPLHVQDGQYGSHWDERFMHSSLMTPTIGLPHQTVLDDVTLALFDDTGWYQVNYSRAQPLAWGKDAGCAFLEKNHCQTEEKFFCKPGEPLCHPALLDKATCTAIGDCYLPKSKSQDECRLEKNIITGSADEIYSPRSRCFLSSLSTNNSVQINSRCYEHRCNRSHLLEVRVLGSSWVVCPSGATVKVPGYTGVVQCPQEGTLCLTADPAPTTAPPAVTTTELTHTTRAPYNVSEDAAIMVDVIFSSLPFSVVNRPSDQYIFKRSVLATVVQVTGVKESRIAGVEIIRGSVRVSFILNPDPEKLLTTRDVFVRLRTAILNDQFMVDFSGVSLQPDAISERSMEEAEEESRAHVAIAAGVSVSVLVVCALIFASVALWTRYQKLREQHNVSSNGRLELSDLNSTTSLPNNVADPSGFGLVGASSGLNGPGSGLEDLAARAGRAYI